MPAFPTVARLQLSGATEQRESALVRDSVEAGPPKQRRVKSRVLVAATYNVVFQTAADYATFLTWFATDVKNGQDWFDFREPRTGQVVQARFVAGQELGPATALRASWGAVQVQITVEYWSA